MKKLQFLFMLVCCIISITATSQVPFTPGNVVVVRLGDGTNSYAGVSAPAFLDEYTVSGAFVQSVALPAADNGANLKVTFDYNKGPQGMLTLSANTQYLTMFGYNALPNVPVSSLASSTVPRIIARIDYNSIANTTTSVPGTDVGSNRAAIAAITNSGNDFWVTSASPTSELRYTTLGQTTSVGLISGGSNTMRVPTIYDGQLYCATHVGTLVSIGTGLPTTGPQSYNFLPGIDQGASGQCQAFFADLDASIPGFDVIYMSQEGEKAITKFSLVAGTWVSNGTIGVDADDYRGITGSISGNTVTLYCTRKILANSSAGGGELVALTDNSGYNGAFTGTPTILVTAAANTAFRGVAMAPVAPPLHVSAKVYLQGAYSTTVGRNKDVSANWAAALNAGALSQPYNSSSFSNYNGGESKSAGFFQSNASPINTDITDWVLVELRNAVTPTTIVARRAAFVREDGKVVDLDGTSDVTFPGIPAGNYYIVIRHRNHLSVRSATAIALNENAATTYDFTTSQSQAYQDPAITTNAAMKDLTGTGVFGMWAGNANSNTAVRSFGGTATTNDFLQISNIGLGGNVAATQGPPAGSPVYSTSDVNMDGSVRAVGGTAALNDFLFLWNTCLGGNLSQTITAHQ